MAALAAGCATSAQYQAYVQRWSGAGELELVRAWGPPQESYTVQGHKFLAYITKRQIYVPAPPTMWSCPGWPAAPCMSPWPNPAGWIEQLRCKTVFELDQDRVIGSHWEGNGCEAPENSPR
jgi:hypothetical protein